MDDVEIHQEISQACAHLRKVRATHLESRFKNLDELLTEYESDNDPLVQEKSARKANIVCNTIHTEKIRTMFRKIGHAVITEAIRQDSQSSHSPPPRSREGRRPNTTSSNGQRS
jgi:hypothetical protein